MSTNVFIRYTTTLREGSITLLTFQILYDYVECCKRYRMLALRCFAVSFHDIKLNVLTCIYPENFPLVSDTFPIFHEYYFHYRRYIYTLCSIKKSKRFTSIYDSPGRSSSASSVDNFAMTGINGSRR